MITASRASKRGGRRRWNCRRRALRHSADSKTSPEAWQLGGDVDPAPSSPRGCLSPRNRAISSTPLATSSSRASSPRSCACAGHRRTRPARAVTRRRFRGVRSRPGGGRTRTGRPDFKRRGRVPGTRPYRARKEGKVLDGASSPLQSAYFPNKSECVPVRSKRTKSPSAE